MDKSGLLMDVQEKMDGGTMWKEKIVERLDRVELDEDKVELEVTWRSPSGVWGRGPQGGLGAGALAGSGAAPSNILAAKSPRGLGRSPNRRGPPAPPPLATPLVVGGAGL